MHEKVGRGAAWLGGLLPILQMLSCGREDGTLSAARECRMAHARNRGTIEDAANELAGVRGDVEWGFCGAGHDPGDARGVEAVITRRNPGGGDHRIVLHFLANVKSRMAELTEVESEGRRYAYPQEAAGALVAFAFPELARLFPSPRNKQGR